MVDVHFTLDAITAPAGIIRELAELVTKYPGSSPVYLSIDTSEGWKTYHLGVSVDYCAEFYLAARELGQDAVDH